MQDLMLLDELRDSARRFLDGRLEQSITLRNLWSQVAELGWLSLAMPESSGGFGQPFTALAVLHEELGRVLSPLPFMSTMTCLYGISQLHRPSNAVTALIHRAIAGEIIMVPVPTEEPRREIGDLRSSMAEPDRGGIQLRDDMLAGTAHHVLDAENADYLLICLNANPPRMLLLSLPHPQVSRVHRPMWDFTRRIFSVRFDDVPIEHTVQVGEGDISVALEHMAAHRDLALACDAVGGMNKIFEETLEYMKVRRQFGRPIASFQALKHRCADLHVAIESARALVSRACQDFASLRSNWRTNAAVARLYAEAVYRTVTENAVQLHGGIGFTWEHGCHRFLKRARLSSTLGGSSEMRKDALAPWLFRCVGPN